MPLKLQSLHNIPNNIICILYCIIITLQTHELDRWNALFLYIIV